jgi:hypothetical protein
VLGESRRTAGLARGRGAAAMTDDRPLTRAAWHEAAHAVAAHVHQLPIREVWIDAAGRGGTRYSRLFDRPDIHPWLIGTLAGPAIELLIWGNAPIGDDLKVIDAMVRDMRLTPWSDAILDRYWRAAARFVRRKRDLIEIVAAELLRRQRLTGSDIAVLLA